MPLPTRNLWRLITPPTTAAIQAAFGKLREGSAFDGRLLQESINFWASPTLGLAENLVCHVAVSVPTESINNVIGISCAQIRDRAVVHSITAVHRDWRAKGIASALIREKTTSLLLTPEIEISSSTNIRNSRVQRILLSCGYLPEKIENGIIKYVFPRE